MRHLSFGSGVCDQLFVRVPLTAVAAELQIEAGDKRVKHTATLRQHACNIKNNTMSTHYILFCITITISWHVYSSSIMEQKTSALIVANSKHYSHFVFENALAIITHFVQFLQTVTCICIGYLNIQHCYATKGH